jgi:hypothetical protein
MILSHENGGSNLPCRSNIMVPESDEQDASLRNWRTRFESLWDHHLILQKSDICGTFVDKLQTNYREWANW